MSSVVMESVLFGVVLQLDYLPHLIQVTHILVLSMEMEDY
jgi:hypothetical protein